MLDELSRSLTEKLEWLVLEVHVTGVVCDLVNGVLGVVRDLDTKFSLGFVTTGDITDVFFIISVAICAIC